MGSRSTLNQLDVSRKGITDLAPWLCDQALSLVSSVDLSRNSLTTTCGIEALPHLRSLNLYYNRIEELSELWRLRRCPGLQSLDLRLNPVTRVDGYRA